MTCDVFTLCCSFLSTLQTPAGGSVTCVVLSCRQMHGQPTYLLNTYLYNDRDSSPPHPFIVLPTSITLPPLPSSPPLTLHPFRPLPAALLPNLSLPCLPTPVLLLFPSSFSSPICFFSFAWLHHHNFQGNVLKGFLSCNTRSYPLVSDGSSDAVPLHYLYVCVYVVVYICSCL